MANLNYSNMPVCARSPPPSPNYNPYHPCGKYDEVVIPFPDHTLVRRRRESDRVFDCPACKAAFTHARQCFRHIRHECHRYEKYRQSSAPALNPPQERIHDPRPWPKDRRPPVRERNPMFIYPSQRGGLRAQHERQHQRRWVEHPIKAEGVPQAVLQMPHTSSGSPVPVSLPQAISKEEQAQAVPLPVNAASSLPSPPQEYDQLYNTLSIGLQSSQADPREVASTPEPGEIASTPEPGEIADIHEAQTVASQYDRASSPVDMDISSDPIMPPEDNKEAATSFLNDLQGTLQASQPDLTCGETASTTSTVHAFPSGWNVSSPAPAPLGLGLVNSTQLFFHTPQRPTTCTLPNASSDALNTNGFLLMEEPPKVNAVLEFLNGLERPLGQYYPVFQQLGITSAEDLDLVSRLRDDWETIRQELGARGVNLMDWLRIKGALENRSGACTPLWNSKSLLTRISDMKAESF
ncbi:hypothetical protein NM688_g405 [Phlebia brevispora]|uniref:Uncharacterized protein n=1 Tax=Phlebia brevispora TaxID=194682 RepID=A0ACC1TEJ6_9APHY|nr:hypothetical protein NM688_g405 [Phlebia brevispora]